MTVSRQTERQRVKGCLNKRTLVREVDYATTVCLPLHTHLFLFLFLFFKSFECIQL